MATLTRADNAFVIDFGSDENVATDIWAAEMHAFLDEVEVIDEPKVLITTGSAKHYSNGLDVSYMSSVEPDEVVAYVRRMEKVLCRLLTFPAPTVAAVNGHSFGLGAFLVLVHDHAVMREDRGFFCLPEVHLQMSFPPSLMSVLAATLSAETRRRATLTGHRYSGPACVAAGIVDEVAPKEGLLEAAIDRGRPHATTAGPNLGLIKRQLFGECVQLLGEKPPIRAAEG